MPQRAHARQPQWARRLRVLQMVADERDSGVFDILQPFLARWAAGCCCGAAAEGAHRQSAILKGGWGWAEGLKEGREEAEEGGGAVEGHGEVVMLGWVGMEWLVVWGLRSNFWRSRSRDLIR
jgi:hypothetical protein